MARLKSERYGGREIRFRKDKDTKRVIGVFAYRDRQGRVMVAEMAGPTKVYVLKRIKKVIDKHCKSRA